MTNGLVINTGTETWLDLEAAAKCLGMHSESLRDEAVAGNVRGFKRGKEWRFRESRLIEYANALEDNGGRPLKLGSTRERKRGTQTSASQTAEEIGALLAQPIKRKRTA